MTAISIRQERRTGTVGLSFQNVLEVAGLPEMASATLTGWVIVYETKEVFLAKGDWILEREKAAEDTAMMY